MVIQNEFQKTEFSRFFFCWTLRFLSFAVRNLILPMQNWYNWNGVFHLLFVLSKRCLLINAFIIVDYIKFQTNKNTPTKITEKNNEKIHFNFLIHQMNNMGDETCWKAFHFFFRFGLFYCCWFFFSRKIYQFQFNSFLHDSVYSFFFNLRLIQLFIVAHKSIYNFEFDKTQWLVTFTI